MLKNLFQAIGNEFAEWVIFCGCAIGLGFLIDRSAATLELSWWVELGWNVWEDAWLLFIVAMVSRAVRGK